MSDDGASVEHDRRLPSLEDDKPTLHVSIVVPAYNETRRIGIMLDEALEHLNRRYKDDWEIVIVDDGSRDATADEALRWAMSKVQEGQLADPDRLRVIRLVRNRGKGGAVTHGIRHVRGRYVCFADADGATRFSDIDNLFAALSEIERDDGHGLAGGSRAHMVRTDAVVKRSAVRNALMHGFHTFISVLGVRHIKDTQCGFKLFTRQTCAAIFPHVHIERYAFDVEVWLLASWLEIPVVEVPVTWHEVGGSQMNLVKDSLNMAWDLVLMRCGYTLGFWQVQERQDRQ